MKTEASITGQAPPSANGNLSREHNAGLSMSPERPECVQHLFERQAKRAPDAIAAASCRHVLSYGELNRRADALASRLRALGVGPETVVGVCLPRSAAMIVGALGILKSGAAYLPMDPSEPGIRSDLMLRDAGVSILVTDRDLQDQARGGDRRVLSLDGSGRIIEPATSVPPMLPPTPGSLKDLAYVIYTSGSTGAPRGVDVTHESLFNLVAWHQRAFAITPADRATCVARVGFDASVWEIWPYLAAGASLHVPGEDRLNDPAAFQSWLIEQRITVSFVPTPMAERLLALHWPPETALRLMLTGGDTLHTYPPPDLPFRLINNYGPTECAVVATSGPVPPARPGSRLPPIGRPIDRTQIYILDDALREVPVGTAGEMYIGGAGVARGYRNRPELTAERFIANPIPGATGRVFRTGDRAQYLPDGQIAFLGRLDEQIKIRGFRIEPGEVAAALNGHPAVSQCAVIAREATPGDLRLVAYFVPSAGSSPTFTELREFAGARLPGYMVPSTFVGLDSIPLTPNGKVDRAALPAPDAANTVVDGTSRGPQTEVEEVVAGILAPLLGIEQVDVEANFFSLGGHSLLGFQLISRVRECLGIELPLRTVFEAPSVVELSAEIENLLCAKLEAMTDDEVQRTLNATAQEPS